MRTTSQSLVPKYESSPTSRGGQESRKQGGKDSTSEFYIGDDYAFTGHCGL